MQSTVRPARFTRAAAPSSCWAQSPTVRASQIACCHRASPFEPCRDMTTTSHPRAVRWRARFCPRKPVPPAITTRPIGVAFVMRPPPPRLEGPAAKHRQSRIHRGRARTWTRREGDSHQASIRDCPITRTMAQSCLLTLPKLKLVSLEFPDSQPKKHTGYGERWKLSRGCKVGS